jgi:hypothetical protein
VIELNEIVCSTGAQRIDWHRRVREGREAAAAKDRAALGELAIVVAPSWHGSLQHPLPRE